MLGKYYIMVVLHLRITTSSYTLEQVENFVKSVNPDKYIVAQEIVPYNHYHCHFEYLCSNFTDYQKRKLGQTVVKHFNLEGGNRQYGISEDKGKSAVYTVKDGKFVSRGYTANELKTLYAESTSKLNFKGTLKQLLEKYNDNHLSFGEYCHEYIVAHVDSLKPLSDFRVEAHFRTVYLSKNSALTWNYSRSIQRRSQQWCD